MAFASEYVNVQRPPLDALIDMKFITADCLLSDKWIYRLISQERFPRPIKLGECHAGGLLTITIGVTSRKKFTTGI